MTGGKQKPKLLLVTRPPSLVTIRIDDKTQSERTGLRPLKFRAVTVLQPDCGSNAYASIVPTLAAARPTVKAMKVASAESGVRSQKAWSALDSRLRTRGSGLLPLLDLDGRARVGQLDADGLGLVLRDALFDGLRRAVNEVFGLLEAQRRDLADDLDDVDLLAARGL